MLLEELSSGGLEALSTEEGSSDAHTPREGGFEGEERSVAVPEEPQIYDTGDQVPKLQQIKGAILRRPKHLLAPRPTHVFFKYTEEYYLEETIPDVYTGRDKAGRGCRYITNFLVYNAKAERLHAIEELDSRKQTLYLYGHLVPMAAISHTRHGSVYREKRRRVKRPSPVLEGDQNAASTQSMMDPDDTLYPVRIALAKWTIEMGPRPEHAPAIWLISAENNYYRLEVPAGRFKDQFQKLEQKFQIASRFLKTLQSNVQTSFEELVAWMTGWRLTSEGWQQPPYESENESNVLLTTWGEPFRIPGLHPKAVVKAHDFIRKQAESFAELVFAPDEDKSPLLNARAMHSLMQQREEKAREERVKSRQDSIGSTSGARQPSQLMAPSYAMPTYEAYPSHMQQPSPDVMFQHPGAPPMPSQHGGKCLMPTAAPGYDMMNYPISYMAPFPYMVHQRGFKPALHVLANGCKVLPQWHFWREEQQRQKWPYLGTHADLAVIGTAVTDEVYPPPPLVSEDMIPSPLIDLATYPPQPALTGHWASMQQTICAGPAMAGMVGMPMPGCIKEEMNPQQATMQMGMYPYPA